MERIEQSRMDRRDTLKWIAAATTSLPIVRQVGVGAEPSAKGYGPDPDLLRAYQPGDLWPLTFSEAQLAIVIVLCDIVIPVDETSPSASSLGVQHFIDEWISSPYPGQESDRKLILKGLQWLDEEAGRRDAADFVSLAPGDQLKICEELAILAKRDRRKYPGTFFRRIRDLVAGGYYTTPAGMKDIGYRGNVAMPEWNGPPAEVLEKLGLSAQEKIEP